MVWPLFCDHLGLLLSLVLSTDGEGLNVMSMNMLFCSLKLQ